VTTVWTRVLLLSAVTLAAGCRHAGEYVWVQDLPPDAGRDAEYVIAPGDTLAVRVWNQEGHGGTARVRSDGKISLPFVDDVAAAGRSPNDLARDLEVRLTAYVRQPRVTVALEDERLMQVSVVGEVARPGTYDLAAGACVLQALAGAGGLSEFARKERIFVLRKGAAGERPLRIRFDYEALSRAEPAAATFRLRRGDVVVVD
jgi:polysaccharide export outer membrane protein